MTPQERQLVVDLFDRLARLEDAPRDATAEAVIDDGLARAPHALYALVQTALVQDEALKRADARIRELEHELGVEESEAAAPRERGFLDSMRDALFGDRERDPPRGSVPNAGGRPMGVPPAFRGAPAAPAAQPEGGRGGSFLGTAAAAAAGVIGGSLLLDGIRSAWGSAPQAGKAGAFDADAGKAAPWGEGSGDLGRQAGLDDIGRGGHGREEGAGHGYGLLDHGDEEMDVAEEYDFDLGDNDLA